MELDQSNVVVPTPDAPLSISRLPLQWKPPTHDEQMRYMLSVAGNYNFLEFISNAKSGEFFFFSHDERFMIKTLKVNTQKLCTRLSLNATGVV